ncbi:hypothetical protein [Kitasatospora phosalacinea]|uniref:Uncharacterized protein n=1 Tax=Kitasatospora phosalacinea TaxID=2065 RepID=A0A9W6USI2_9ACTN|nr:hypothetical protein [Kitasatospora phosalacinea]GLW59489.1 hypothetical protein Kpho01_74990 [Kitasatospora phosalacinea]
MSIDPVGYAAFVELHHGLYEKYARARLGDAGLAEQVVALVLRRTEANWAWALRDDPAAFAWRSLCEAVTLARKDAPTSPLDGLRRDLPDRAADAAILHESLGLEPADAAALMGLEEPAVHAQLQAARRWRADRDAGSA